MKKMKASRAAKEEEDEENVEHGGNDGEMMTARHAKNGSPKHIYGSGLLRAGTARHWQSVCARATMRLYRRRDGGAAPCARPCGWWQKALFSCYAVALPAATSSSSIFFCGSSVSSMPVFSLRTVVTLFAGQQPHLAFRLLRFDRIRLLF